MKLRSLFMEDKKSERCRYILLSAYLLWTFITEDILLKYVIIQKKGYLRFSWINICSHWNNLFQLTFNARSLFQWNEDRFLLNMKSLGSFSVANPWHFERMRVYLRRLRLHSWHFLLDFVEKDWLHIGVPMNVIREVDHRGITTF